MKRAENLIRNTYGENCGPAIRLLVEFACQNSGIDARNYYDPRDYTSGRKETWHQGVSAYREECRSISADFKRFKDALSVASAEGVADREVIEASKSAFSGRLEWVAGGYKLLKDVDIENISAKVVGKFRAGEIVQTDDPGVAHYSLIYSQDGRATHTLIHCDTLGPKIEPHWEYTTGQYFPTEYRKAAASVLEEAIRQVRKNRPPQTRKVASISELKALNAANGGCWFAPGEIRFFGTRIESGIIRGKYFITSEQPPHGSRKYSVRSFDEKGDIDTVGDFCSHSTKVAAMAAVPKD